MKRETVSKLQFGTRVKLTPQGEWYTVLTLAVAKRGKYTRDVVLRDDAGKEKAVSYGASVYYNPGEPQSNRGQNDERRTG